MAARRRAGPCGRRLLVNRVVLRDGLEGWEVHGLHGGGSAHDGTEVARGGQAAKRGM